MQRFSLSEQQLCKILPSFLNGFALERYRQLDLAIKNNFQDLIEELKQKLQKPESASFAQQQMLSCAQASDESVQTFSARLLQLCRDAYKDAPDEVRDSLLRETFLKGLTKRLRQYTRAREPKKFMDAVEAAMTVDAQLRLDGQIEEERKENSAASLSELARKLDNLSLQMQSSSDAAASQPHGLINAVSAPTDNTFRA